MRESCPSEELLALLAAGALEPEETSEIESHAVSCPACSRALETSRSVSRALRDLPLPAPSEAGKQRAFAAVLKAMEARAAESTRPSAPTLKVLGKAGTPAAPSRRRFQLVAALTSGLAAAACLMLLIGTFQQRASAPPSVASAGLDRASRKVDADVTSKIKPAGTPMGSGAAVANDDPSLDGGAAPGHAELAKGLAPEKARALAVQGQGAASDPASGTPNLAAIDPDVLRRAAVSDARAVLLVADYENASGSSSRRQRQSFAESKKADKKEEAEKGSGGAAPRKPTDSPTGLEGRRSEPDGPSKDADSVRGDDAPAAPGEAQTFAKPSSPSGAGARDDKTRDASKLKADDKAPAPTTSAPAPAAAPAPDPAPKQPRAGLAQDALIGKPTSGRWVLGDSVLVLENDRFFRTTPVATQPPTLVDPADVAVQALALRALDQEVGQAVHDRAWASRVVALARLSGIDSRPAVRR